MGRRNRRKLTFENRLRDIFGIPGVDVGIAGARALGTHTGHLQLTTHPRDGTLNWHEQDRLDVTITIPLITS
jgi:hypothetical protein